MLEIKVNEVPRTFALDSPATVADVVAALNLRADRIAVELGGEIVPRTAWASTEVRSGERLEVVHFVGGGA